MKIGDRVEARTYDGRFCEGVVTAIVTTTKGVQITVKCGDRVVMLPENRVSILKGKNHQKA